MFSIVQKGTFSQQFDLEAREDDDASDDSGSMPRRRSWWVSDGSNRNNEMDMTALLLMVLFICLW